MNTAQKTRTGNDLAQTLNEALELSPRALPLPSTGERELFEAAVAPITAAPSVNAGRPARPMLARLSDLFRYHSGYATSPSRSALDSLGYLASNQRD